MNKGLESLRNFRAESQLRKDYKELDKIEVQLFQKKNGKPHLAQLKCDAYLLLNCIIDNKQILGIGTDSDFELFELIKLL